MNPQGEYTKRKLHKATYSKTMKASDKKENIKTARGGEETHYK